MRKRQKNQSRGLREELEHSRSLYLCSKLVAGIVHEINSPLDGVINAVRVLKSAKLSAERSREYLDRIEAELFRTGSLVKRLLGLSREQPFDFQPVDVNDIVRKCIFFTEYRMQQNRVRLQTELAGDTPKVSADQTALMQVLVNLILNAVEAMPNGGRLTLSTEADAERVLVVVGDTGGGIAEEHIGRIFHPFFTTKKGSNDGLGLAIALNIVEQHRGELTVESVPGKGSIFTVRLPRQ